MNLKKELERLFQTDDAALRQDMQDRGHLRRHDLPALSFGGPAPPFSDARGLPLTKKEDPVDLGSGDGPAVDTRDPAITPREAYKMLPSFLKDSLYGMANEDRHPYPPAPPHPTDALRLRMRRRRKHR